MSRRPLSSTPVGASASEGKAAVPPLPAPEAVAEFLRAHPAFFEAHGELLGGLSLPSAHGNRAISLHERQLEVLRERNRVLEGRMAELMRIGEENDSIVDRLLRWARNLLLEADAARLPTVVREELAGPFSMPQIAMRLWNLREPYRQLPEAEAVEPEVVTLTDGMKQPYCGPNAEFVAATWLPGGGLETRSLALIPLRKRFEGGAFGLLVLGSADPDRFSAGLGTDFLSRIGETASAALARLAD